MLIYNPTCHLDCLLKGRVLTLKFLSHENLPYFCTHCSTIGHFVGECRALKKVQEESAKADTKTLVTTDAKAKSQQKKSQQYIPKQTAPIHGSSLAPNATVVPTGPFNNRSSCCAA